MRAVTELEVAVGSVHGASMRIRVRGGELVRIRKVGSIVEGRIPSWERVEVITGLRRAKHDSGPATTYRYWLLMPGDTQQVVSLGSLHVSGCFTVVEQVNGKKASEAWHTSVKEP